MEKIFRYLSFSSSSLIVIILLAVLVTLIIQAKPAIEEFGLKFFIEHRWGVEKQSDASDIQANVKGNSQSFIEDEDDLFSTGSDDGEKTANNLIYGAAVPIVGSLLSTLIALIFALPLAFGIAIFLSEIASRAFATPIGICIELLASIPSIIYGMWGLFYFGPLIAEIFGGNSVSLLIAGLVLGIMIVPFIAALTRDSIKSTPVVLKESAYAIGATKFEVIKDIIFPFAKAGIVGSVIIALGRAIGETMAVAFVIGGIFTFATTPTSPTISAPVALANNFAEASGMYMSSLFYLSLILFIISLIIILLAKLYFFRKQIH